MKQADSGPQVAASDEKRSRLSAADWEREALVLIASKGVSGLAVEPLARRMGITKGSFYWHFSNRDALLAQALEGWEKHDSRNLAASLGQIDHPRGRLRDFFHRVAKERLTHEVYRELCAAAGDPIVEPVLERVTQRRMTYLTDAFEEMGLDRQAAENQARLAYSAYLGFLQLQRQNQALDMDSDAYLGYVEHVIAKLLD